MHLRRFIAISLTLPVLLFSYIQAYATINVVAAENFYGNVAKLIGGDYVNVKSIISNPDADPHLFSTSPSTAVALHDAKVIIYNGASYDPWMKQLLNTSTQSHPVIINVADLMKVKEGDNPHVWFNPKTFPTLAKELAAKFSQLEPKHKKTFMLNLKTFLDRDQEINKLISEIKSKFAGTKVTATEPVFGYMAEALGLQVMDEKFQWVIMNDAEPTPKMLINYQNLLKDHQVKVLFYNNQVSDNTTQSILKLAQDNHIAVVGVSETMPQDANVITWLKSLLKDTQNALIQANKPVQTTPSE